MRKKFPSIASSRKAGNMRELSLLLYMIYDNGDGYNF